MKMRCPCCGSVMEMPKPVMPKKMHESAEAKAACDRLNFIAGLEMLRDPSGAMIDAAAWFESPEHGPRSNAGIWRAMIDALIKEVKNSGKF